jgi:Uma2 family endonuclease
MTVPTVTSHRFTVEDYHRMGETGILKPESQVELIEGEIVHRAPIGSQHAAFVGRLLRVFIHKVGYTAFVNAQSPLQLSSFSEPQPDLLVLRPKDDDYAAALPGPEDVLLLVEVADSSLEYDRSTKLRLYGQSGIKEVWIVNVRERLVEVYSQPSSTGYADLHRAQPEETLILQALPSCTIPLSKIFRSP